MASFGLGFIRGAAAAAACLNDLVLQRGEIDAPAVQGAPARRLAPQFGEVTVAHHMENRSRQGVQNGEGAQAVPFLRRLDRLVAAFGEAEQVAGAVRAGPGAKIPDTRLPVSAVPERGLGVACLDIKTARIIKRRQFDHR